MKENPCIVVLGASAGGLEAFKEFLQAVKPDSGLAYIILQHLDPKHKSMLADLLNSNTNIPVVEITNRLKLECDKAYVLPSHAIPLLKDGHFKLEDRDENETSLYLLDTFFESVARQYGHRATGVILSGTGNDGTRGLAAIKNAQGITFAQKPTSAKWPDMPKSAIDHGIVDFVMEPDEIAQKIYDLSLPNAPMQEQDCVSTETEERNISKILQVLQHQEGMDFNNYKKNTIFRRVKRRMLLGSVKTLPDYVDYLKENKDEISKLFNDLLIPVTSFFRDTKTFEYLNENIFPKILAGKSSEEPVRIWVAGCSTGQEAFSIAISLLDYIKKTDQDNPYGENYTAMENRIKIFATDLSSVAISKARKGFYTHAEVAYLDNRQLKTYFKRTSKGYQVEKNIRKICVFAEHDFLNDFPFGSMNMVSCRNVLIYLDKVLQKKAFTNFHYALKEKGILLLGNSETISSVPDLFENVDKSHKVFRRSNSTKKSIAPITNKISKRAGITYDKPEPKQSSSDIANSLLLESYTPVAVVVDENLELVSIHGSTGKYMEHTSGKASNNFLKLAKGSLGIEVRYLIKDIQDSGMFPLKKEGIRLEYNDNTYIITLEVRPLLASEKQFLIVFKEELQEQEPKQEVVLQHTEAKDAHIQTLEEELTDLREAMLTSVEEHQVAEENLQSANEELMSSTEELQTLNEELETSKEELQSTVEEITIINQELSSLNALLNQEKKFSEAIVRTIRNPLLILNKDLEVIMANNSFYKNFKVKEAETVGRSIYELGNGQWNIERLHTLLDSILPECQSFYDYEVSHNFENIGERTMLLNAQTLKEEDTSGKSILLAFEDITERKEVQSKLLESINTHREFVNSSPWPIAILSGKDHVIDIANKAMLRVWRKEENVIGKTLEQALPELEGQGFMELLDGVYTSGESYEDFEIPASFRNKKNEWETDYFDFVYQPQTTREGEVTGVSVISTVVTNQVMLDKQVKKSEQQFKQLANQVPEMITSYDLQEDSFYYNKSWLDFSGLDSETLLQNGWHSLVHPDDIGVLQLEIERLQKDSSFFEIELRLRNNEGEYLWHLNRTHCIKDEEGKPIKWIGTNTQIQRLKDEEKRKEDFLKLVSHELKTPVTSIKGYVQMLLGMISKDNNKPIKELPVEASLNRVDNQITRLTRLISEILDVSKMSESQLDLNLETFDMCKLVEHTIQDIKHSSGPITITTKYEDCSIVRADKDRIGQVLINFITNAIKYSPENDNVEVEVFHANSDYITVSVKDYGIGIKQEDLARVFDRFYRVSGKNEGTYAGFGIGLFLVKNIVERHHGYVNAESKLGEGSRFEFRLPKIATES